MEFDSVQAPHSGLAAHVVNPKSPPFVKPVAVPIREARAWYAAKGPWLLRVADYDRNASSRTMRGYGIRR